MTPHSNLQIRKKKEMVKEIIRHHFAVPATRINFKTTGLTNFVFSVKCKAGDFIVRISDTEEKIQDYQKEQWVISKVRNEGIPVGEILEVGNQIIMKPYMLQKEIKGEVALNHPDRHAILQSLGELAKRLHSIKTSHFGKVFDWSQNILSKNKTWKDFLKNELMVESRLNILGLNKILPANMLDRLFAMYAIIKKWNPEPRLNHGDLRLKNVLIDKKARIAALIDWEESISNIAPHWDLSIALHDLSIDAKQHFITGYGLNAQQFEAISQFVKFFNVLNYAPVIEKLALAGDRQAIAFYRLRLNGHFDLSFQ